MCVTVCVHGCDRVCAWLIVDSGEAPSMSVSPLLLMLDFLEIVVACSENREGSYQEPDSVRLVAHSSDESAFVLATKGTLECIHLMLF